MPSKTEKIRSQVNVFVRALFPKSDPFIQQSAIEDVMEVIERYETPKRPKIKCGCFRSSFRCDYHADKLK